MKDVAAKTAKMWANDNYIDESDRIQIKKLIDDNNEEEITEAFHKNLEFGTGGMRAIIGLGSNRINKYNVRKAVQAMCNQAIKKPTAQKNAAVSFDCRDFSIEFSKEAACVYAANGFKTYLFKELTPTPMLSYAVRYYNCQMGAMITASHNPKQYNGFKAYWSDGSQVTPPNDQAIINEYESIENWDQIKTMDFDQAISCGMIEYITNDFHEAFYAESIKCLINTDMAKKDGGKAKFIYTPLHGTGYIPCLEISKRLGYTNFDVLEEQATFDGSFSTVESTPNPEDPIALKLVVKRMLEGNYDIAYGTDPDGDRLGVVVNNNGVPEYLNGNQIAFLMLDYMFSHHIKNGTLPEKPLVIKSIVTSPLQSKITHHYGGTIMDTLTGFKWMAHLWRELEESGTDYTYFFASEESFGYMPGNFVRDKDAITSMALMNEIVLYNKLNGKTLIDALGDIYEKLGYAQESLIALTFEGLSGRDKINSIMKYFREEIKADIANEKVLVKKDYDSLKSINFQTNLSEDIKMEKSNVLGFEFESGNILYVRPSGTEPKIKFYTMVNSTKESLSEKKLHAKEMINTIESFIHNTLEVL